MHISGAVAVAFICVQCSPRFIVAILAAIIARRWRRGARRRECDAAVRHLPRRQDGGGPGSAPSTAGGGGFVGTPARCREPRSPSRPDFGSVPGALISPLSGAGTINRGAPFKFQNTRPGIEAAFQGGIRIHGTFIMNGHGGRRAGAGRPRRSATMRELILAEQVELLRACGVLPAELAAPPAFPDRRRAAAVGGAPGARSDRRPAFPDRPHRRRARPPRRQ